MLQLPERTLIHASLCPVEGGRFYPRIPKLRNVGEDRTIPRICFSMALEDCIYSMPAGVLIMRNLLWLRGRKIHPAFYVYTLEQGEYDPDNLVRPGKVKRYVPDALLNQEFWIVNQEVVCQEHIVSLEEFDCYVGFNEDGRLVHGRIKAMDVRKQHSLPRNNPMDYLRSFETEFYGKAAGSMATRLISSVLLEKEYDVALSR